MTQNNKQTYVLILAAGQGKRMLPLTKERPKPLLTVQGTSLIEHHIIRLQKMGFYHIVVNIAYLAHKIRTQLGNGEHLGVHIIYSDETHHSHSLETAGGIAYALPLIKSAYFLVINADIWTDYPFNALIKNPFTYKTTQAKLVLVKNPAHNKKGDFAIQQQKLHRKTTHKDNYTFSGIGIYHRTIFENLPIKHKALASILFTLIDRQEVEAEYYRGEWIDIGTPERLAALNQNVSTE